MGFALSPTTHTGRDAWSRGWPGTRDVSIHSNFRANFANWTQATRPRQTSAVGRVPGRAHCLFQCTIVGHIHRMLRNKCAKK